MATNSIAISKGAGAISSLQEAVIVLDVHCCRVGPPQLEEGVQQQAHKQEGRQIRAEFRLFGACVHMPQDSTI